MSHDDQPSTTIRGRTRLCDDDGVVRAGVMHDGEDYPCTGSAHFDGVQIECTNPIHDERDVETVAEVIIKALFETEAGRAVARAVLELLRRLD